MLKNEKSSGATVTFLFSIITTWSLYLGIATTCFTFDILCRHYTNTSKEVSGLYPSNNQSGLL